MKTTAITATLKIGIIHQLCTDGLIHKEEYQEIKVLIEREFYAANKKNSGILPCVNGKV